MTEIPALHEHPCSRCGDFYACDDPFCAVPHAEYVCDDCGSVRGVFSRLGITFRAACAAAALVFLLAATPIFAQSPAGAFPPPHPTASSTTTTTAPDTDAPPFWSSMCSKCPTTTTIPHQCFVGIDAAPQPHPNGHLIRLEIRGSCLERPLWITTNAAGVLEIIRSLYTALGVQTSL